MALNIRFVVVRRLNPSTTIICQGQLLAPQALQTWSMYNNVWWLNTESKLVCLFNSPAKQITTITFAYQSRRLHIPESNTKQLKCILYTQQINNSVNTSASVSSAKRKYLMRTLIIIPAFTRTEQRTSTRGNNKYNYVAFINDCVEKNRFPLPAVLIDPGNQSLFI